MITEVTSWSSRPDQFKIERRDSQLADGTTDVENVLSMHGSIVADRPAEKLVPRAFRHWGPPMSEGVKGKDEERRDVFTPAGPRPPDQVHALRPGESVRRNEDGTYAVVKDQSAEGDAMLVDNTQVLTPGGYRPLSMVYLVDPANAIRLDGERVTMVDANGAQLADLGTMASVPGNEPLLPDVAQRLAAQLNLAPPPAPLGTGWIVYAGWTNTSGQPVSSFETSWVVPPAPATSSGQLIYLFNGIQNSSSILQPVLQWGAGPAGGGNYWAVANWYVGGPNQPAFHGPLLQVNPGDVLVGVMTLTGPNVAGFNYTSDFRGLTGTSLAVLNIPQLTWCNETLEAYGVTQASDYPNVADTRFTSIAITCGTVTPTINWTPKNQVTDVGQHVGDIDNSATAGSVDLWYSDMGSWRLWKYDGTQADVLPGSPVSRGQWHTIRDGHELIRMPDGKVLERVAADGSWWLWNYDPNATDVLPGNPVAQGTWSTIGSDHVLVPLSDGKVIDWVPTSGAWRLWKYDSSSGGDILPGDPLATGQWSSIGAGHTLLPMPDGKILDWVPATGAWRLWNYDSSLGGDPLPGAPVLEGIWASINNGHVLITPSDGRVLDWVPSDGTWRLWSYDPNASDPLSTKLASGTWSTIRSSHALVVMADGKVLDWMLRHA